MARDLNRKGQATLLMVVVISTVVSIFLFSALDVFRRNYEFKAFDFDQALLNEMTVSSFAVIESALARRLWEPPLDKDCLKTESFEASGSVNGEISWKVTAKYDFKTKNYNLLAEGQYGQLRSVFRKRIKVLDVSNYLLFSGSDKPVYLNRRYELTAPAAVLGRDRRIYTKGPLVLDPGTIMRANPMMNWAGTAAGWPEEFGLVLQGERMQFAGGISYRPMAVMRPNPDPSSNIDTMLNPYSIPWGSGVPPYDAQYGGGYAVFTKDINRANTLVNQVRTGASVPLTLATILKEVYPTALFNGTPPLRAWTATDSGTYFSNPNRDSVFYYPYAGATDFQARANYACLSRSGATQKHCSNSNDFPKGFEAWRKNAGLESVLFTEDATELPSPKLGWDHLAALEEDAVACGVVVSTPTNAVQDCPIWDANFVTKYASGAAAACPQVSRLDLDTLTLNNFNAATYAAVANKERFARRVVYLKVPSILRQSNSRGLMSANLPNAVARRNLPLWVVSEDVLALQGLQTDTTSPFSSQPARLREVYFNYDAVSGGTVTERPPLSMVVLSPEQVHLISPFYVPMSSTLLAQSWPRSGGKIRPVRHNFTEASRYETDGYRYGFRRFIIKNVALIASSVFDPSSPFFLRGLWAGGPDSSSIQTVLNQCMVSLKPVQLAKQGADPIALRARIPTYHAIANSPIPRSTSLFYGGKTFFASFYWPAVFEVQQDASSMARQSSELDLTGVRVYVDFSSDTSGGKRALSVPLSLPAERLSNVFDLSHKVITYDYGRFYDPLPPQTPCIATKITFLEKTPGYTYEANSMLPYMNNGRYILVQHFPDTLYQNIGSFVGVEHPVIETLLRPGGGP